MGAFVEVRILWQWKDLLHHQIKSKYMRMWEYDIVIIMYIYVIRLHCTIIMVEEARAMV